MYCKCGVSEIGEEVLEVYDPKKNNYFFYSIFSGEKLFSCEEVRLEP